MHLFDAATRFYGGNAIVGGHLPLSLGFGLAMRTRQEPRVAVCFFGEGAAAEGEFHESLNLAALWSLPVIFCCENNFYAMGTAMERSQAGLSVAAHARGYGLSAETVDGMDVLAVQGAMKRAVAEARMGGGPRLLEFRTYRFRAHSMFDAQLYRDKAEVEAWKANRDPITLFSTALEQDGLLDPDLRRSLEAEVEAEVEAAVAFAEAGSFEPEAELCRHVVAEPRSTPPPTPSKPILHESSRRTSFREVIGEAIREALDSDPRVLLLGEDVGRYGGCFAVSKGLLDRFGEERVRDTPLSESAFTGAGIGAAMDGLRPIVELMTVNFSMLALDQILNNAATLRHMSGGQVGVPLVIRMATGAGRQLAAQHSHSLEGWYAHIPGLRVLAPATLEDARGMLWTALQESDPVLIFESISLYPVEGELPADPHPWRDIHRAAIRRPGRDLTLIAHGAALPKAMAAAAELATAGIEAEVIDLRVLRPLDEATIVESVCRTGRVLLVDEGWRSGSLSAEVAARIAEAAFWHLDAPIRRVCGVEVPIPYPRHLELAALPEVATIVSVARALVEGDHG
jgi:pyruvate dehydrogenase E1 component beta subunit/2-oxoisovalerate dehydrogenase E1 component